MHGLVELDQLTIEVSKTTSVAMVRVQLGVEVFVKREAIMEACTMLLEEVEKFSLARLINSTSAIATNLIHYFYRCQNALGAMSVFSAELLHA